MTNGSGPAERPPAAAEPDPGVEQLTDLISAVNALHGQGSDAGLIDRIAALEHLKASCAAAQAKLAYAFAVQHTAAVLGKITDPKSREYAADRTRKSVGRQIGLACQASPSHGRRLLGVATALNTDLPGTLTALAAGRTTEQRVMDIVTQFACLTPGDRRKADELIAPQLPHLGNQSTGDTARGIAAELDPEAVPAKIRGAVTDRHVSLRPAPDTMTRLSALLPVGMGVAVRAELEKAAAAAMSAPGGESRGRGQIMADELVNRITGQAITGCDEYGVPIYDAAQDQTTARRPADVDVDVDDDLADTAQTDDAATDIGADRESPCNCHHTGDKPAEEKRPSIQLRIVMTDRAFFGDDNEPAHLHGYGKIPAPIARAMLAREADRQTRIWIKRLYTDPANKQLLSMDSRARLFPAGIADFVLNRDQVCRTPWCDAPIRQLDHIQRHADGGPTNVYNAQGLCQACNLAKEIPDWTSTPDPDGTITTTTPTGHTFDSPPPPPPRSRPWTAQPALPPGWAEIVVLGHHRYARAG